MKTRNLARTGKVSPYLGAHLPASPTIAYLADNQAGPINTEM